MHWSFGLTDLSGNAIGEVLNAQRSLNLRLNKTPVADLTISLDNSLAQEVIDRLGDVLLVVYQGSTVRFTGDLLTAVESGPGYKRILSRESLLNQGYSLPRDFPTDTDIRWQTNADSVTARGLFQGVIPSQELGDSQLRQALVDAYVAVRSVARETVEMSSAAEEGASTLSCNFAGPLWRLTKRLIGLPYPSASSSFNTTADDIIMSLLGQANANLDTGIRAGTQSTLYTTQVGTDPSWAFKPVSEGITDLQEAKIPFPVATPTSWIAKDAFPGSASFTTGATDDQGNTYTVQIQGSGPTWTEGSGYLSRSTADAGICTALTNATAQTASIGGLDFYSTLDSQTSNLELAWYVYLRYSGTSDPYASGTKWVRLVISFAYSAGVQNGAVIVQKKLTGTTGSGSPVEIGRFAFTGTSYFTATTWYTARFLVESSGNFAVWTYAQGVDLPSPGVTGQDNDLATGGTLASGTFAFGVNNETGVTVNQILDNVFMSSYTGPQSFDFEIAPSYPTSDVDGIKVGTLNVAARIGTDKPNVIFERGGGANVRPTPTFGSDYILGDSVTARAIHNGQTRFNGQVRVFGIDLSIDENGKETLTPILIEE